MAAIRHIEFWVSDLKASMGFYEPLFLGLGWERVDDHSFALDGTKIYFLVMTGISPAIKTFGPRHLCFTAKDKQTVDTIARLPAVSEKILHTPAELHEGGSYMLVFRDPDGYILEIAYKQ